MISSVGYYSIFDMVLALRQIYSVERFKPYCSTLEDLIKRLSDKDMEMINTIGDLSRGWLDFIEVLIEDFTMGIKSPEESLIKIKSNPSRYYFHDDTHFDSFISIWNKHITDLISKNSSLITSKSFKFAEIDSNNEMIEFITDTSDRFELIDSSIIKFNIKPDFEFNVVHIRNLIILPSIFASRKVTFWNNNNNFVFYISIKDEASSTEEPSEMLLLKTLAFNDKTRLKMLRILTRSSQSVNDLANELNVNPSTISRHMKVFKDTGFVDVQTRDKNTVYYTLNKTALKTSLGDIYGYISSEEL